MRKSPKRGVILQKIREYYCVTGKAMTIRQLATEIGMRPQNLNRITNSLAKSSEITVIGSNQKRQTKYLLPMNALVAPSLFKYKSEPRNSNRYSDSDFAITGTAALFLRKFYSQNIPMKNLEAYLREMEINPSETWNRWL